MRDAHDQTPPLAVSVREAGSMLGVSRATVYRLINKDELRAVKCGHRTLIVVESVHQFLNNAPPAGRQP